MKAAARILVGVLLVAILVVSGGALANTPVEDWMVNLALTTDPYIGAVPGPGYNLAFGAQDGATEGFDAAEGDQIAPQPPQEGVEAYFHYPSNPQFQRNLVTSVVGPAETIVWPLRVRSVGDPLATDAILSWDLSDIANVPAKYATLELRTTGGTTLADMRTQASYTFELEPGQTRSFHVVAATVTYTVTFAEQNQLAGAEIRVYSDAGRTQQVTGPILTNFSGEATKQLENGSYWFTANMTGYHDYDGDFTVAGQARTVEFTMEVIPASHTVTFAEQTPLGGVEIRVYADSGRTQQVTGPIFTNSSGEATKELENGNYWFTATLTGYHDYDGDFAVAGQARTVEFTMLEIPPTYTVTFMVEDTAEDPIDGASVVLQGIGATDTNQDGNATFDNVVVGTHNYTVSKEFHMTVTGAVEVIDQHVEVPVTLTECPVYNIDTRQGYMTIQAAIDEAGTGHTIMVKAGQYDAFVVEGKADISIISTEGATVTTAIEVEVWPEQSLWFMALVDDSEGIVIEGISFDGTEVAERDVVVGIGYLGSTGTVADLMVANIPGSEVGIGVLIAGFDATSTVDLSSVTVNSSMVGVYIANAAASLDGCTITGTGTEGFFGIIAVEASTVSIHDCLISGFRTEDPGPWEPGVGVLVVEGQDAVLSMTQSTISGNNIGLLIGQASDTLITDNSFEDNYIQVLDEGGVLDMQAILDNNTFDRAVVIDRPENSLLHIIWSSIQDAVDEAESGDTIVVYPGEYEENITIDRALTLSGAGAAETKLSAADPGEPVVTIGDYNITLEGFEIDPGSDGVYVATIGYDQEVTLEDLVIHSNTNGIRVMEVLGTLNITGCAISGNVENGIYIYSIGYAPQTVTITGNNITANGDHGIYIMNVAESTLVIEDNVIAENEAYGIYLAGVYNSTVVMKSNKVGAWEDLQGNALGGIWIHEVINDSSLDITDNVVNKNCGWYVGIEIGQIRHSTVTIDDNEINENQIGILVWSVGNSSLVVAGNTMDENQHGIRIQHVGDGLPAALESNGGAHVIVHHNIVSSSQSEGIRIGTVRDGNSVSIIGNTLVDNPVGLRINEIDPVDLELAVKFNNFIDNESWGLLNESGQQVDATHNWWGHLSGPSGNVTDPRTGEPAAGSGDAVSANVTFDPWLRAPVAAVKMQIVIESEPVVDALYEADTQVLVSGNATVYVAGYDGNYPGNAANFTALGKYFDLYVPDVDDVTEIEIRHYYTDDELDAAGLDEESLRLLWWDGDEDNWMECSPGGVNVTAINGYSGYIWAVIGATNTTPTLAQLTGTPFGAYGNPAPEPPSPPTPPTPGPGGGGGGVTPKPTPTTPTRYNLTISSSTGGSVTTPGVGAYTYDERQVVNLVARADDGYRFVNWTGDVGTVANVNSASTTITMRAHYVIRANFEQIPAPPPPTVQYDLSISSTAGGNVTVPGEGTATYQQGTVVTLVATAAEGYRFVNWTGDVGTVANRSSATTTITMSGHYSVSANFESVRVFPWWWIVIGVVVIGVVVFLVVRRRKKAA